MDKKKVIELIKKAETFLYNSKKEEQDYLYDLLTDIEYEVLKPDWISVEDELPPCDEEVFVANIANPKGVWRTYRTKEECPEKDKNDFSCPRGFTITHWISIKLEV